MKRYSTLASMLFLPSLQASSYGFSDYTFINPQSPYHLEGNYKYVDKADFKNSAQGHLNYQEASTALYYTHFVDDENSLTYSLGYDFLNLGWKNNPDFSETQFTYLDGSLGYVSTTLNQWRWIMNTGFSVDTDDFNFGQSGVYHAMLWGRYDIAHQAGIHVGALGWYGVKNGRALPIFGFDFSPNARLKISAIFPVDASISYTLDRNWSLGVMYENLGGPYRYPRRARLPLGQTASPIFSVRSTGVTTLLKFNHTDRIQASLGAGWNFGGSILMKDHENQGKTYSPFSSAPYAQGNLAMTF
ncbi:MAG: hypothetical protein QRY72_01090 [Candidatus Rhabdochlamydia sp.]